MSEHQILFSGPMVRAILEGRKTQTRRVIKAPGGAWKPSLDTGVWCWKNAGDPPTYSIIRNPYGQPGGLLWVRETWRFVGVDMNRHGRTHPVEDAVIEYRAGGTRTIEVDWKLSDVWMRRAPKLWRPSIHMPRWASRLTLRITDVRVQRVQEITEEDAEAEGVYSTAVQATAPIHVERVWVAPGVRCVNVYGDHDDEAPAYRSARQAIEALWDSINAKRGYSWDMNPWVWAITFEADWRDGH